MQKESFKIYSKTEHLKIRSLITFNTGGIQLHENEISNIITENLRKNKLIQKKNKAPKKNIIISMENLHSLSYINESEIYFYYGETLENRRHGWGFLADRNKIIYEGMWYKDQAVGLYISQPNFLVEFGYKDYFCRESSSYKSQIICGKETEIILDNKAQQNTLLHENLSINHFSQTSNSKEILNPCLITGSKKADFSGHMNQALLNKIKEFDYNRRNLFNLNFENTYEINRQAFYRSLSLYNLKNGYQVFNRKKLNEILRNDEKENFNSLENNILGNKKNLTKSLTNDSTCINCKTLIFKQFISSPIYACDCNKWSNEIISLILISNGLLEEAIIFHNHKLTGNDIPMFNEQFIKELGIFDNYSRRFISRLFQQFWGFLDYMDLSLIENFNIKNLSILPYIHRTQIELGSYVSSSSHCIIINGNYKAQKIICKVLKYNIENYEELDPIFRVEFRNNADLFTNSSDGNHDNDENENWKNEQHSPICYIYKHRRDPISKENLFKYIPTSVKMRDWEARILIYLSSHPNIVKCLGISQFNMGYEALILENCEGGSMDQYLITNDTTEFQKLKSEFSASRLEMLSWLRDIATGMQHVHQLGILHRDLKLSNFFISKVNGKRIGKVGDFGIAIFIDSRLGYSPFTDFGNVYYAAPEVLRKEGFFKESDVWSFGMSMIEVITNSFVFDGFCPGLAMVVNAANIDTINKNLDVPFELNKLLKSILDPDRRMRPSFESISFELSRIIEDSQNSAFQKLIEFHAFK
ncbi:sexual stage-specific protein kinase [Cryptosporidium ubiquitum]|uniref:Sexual stage-specific protein kinase n=1 Tax=Cryptosporidium ubiquitum TaxID=857276 RepID=A0A1J4MJI8_9CRYT|nr:sexual stage-specific protein kinase [Cryptosporidium ubiquitum]OII74393.1 sexual stage-specific protein kinase [Cryptosporidium ubiquitum]